MKPTQKQERRNRIMGTKKEDDLRAYIRAYISDTHSYFEDDPVLTFDEAVDLIMKKVNSFYEQELPHP